MEEFNQLTGAKLEVAGAFNERLGHSVTVAGLLMGQDVIAQLEGRDLGEFVILPQIMFGQPWNISLDDISLPEIARRLNRPVFLAEVMGDVFGVFTGRNRRRFDPATETISLDGQAPALPLALG